MNKNRIGKFIKILRKEKGLSQEKLSDELLQKWRIDVSIDAISQWEKGKTIPEIQKLEALAQIFSVSIDEILDGERYKSIDFKKKYFIYNNDWLKNYGPDKKIELYTTRQKQLIDIKTTFEKLLRRRAKDYLTKNEEKEFEFLFRRFYALSDYCYEYINTNINDDYLRLNKAMYKCLKENIKLTVKEKVWELKKLVVPNEDLDLDIYQFLPENFNGNNFIKKRFRELDIYEKDMLLAAMQNSNLIPDFIDQFGSKYLKQYEEKIGESYDKERICKNIIRYLIENGACINRHYLNFIKVHYEEKRIIDRLEELYEMCQKPLSIGVYFKDEIRNYKIENNFRNRFFTKYVYPLSKISKQISKEELFELFQEYDELPEKLYIPLAKEYQIDVNQDMKYIKVDLDYQIKCGIESWKEYKLKEKEIKKGILEIQNLENKLKNGLKTYKIEVREEIGGKTWSEFRDYCYYWNSFVNYKEFFQLRDADLTRKLLEELDNLSLEEIRTKYFNKEEYSDED